jgi:uncharacterized protein YjbJ (UPF0337 family)
MAGHVHEGHQEDKAATGQAPGIGGRISGGVDKMVGKVTNNPNKVAEGQAKSGHL